MCSPLSEVECERYLVSRFDFRMLGAKSDTLVDYMTHNRIFVSVKKWTKGYYFNLLHLT